MKTTLLRLLLRVCLGGALHLGSFVALGAGPQFLLFVDTPGTSPYRTALDNRGYAYQLFTDDLSFNLAANFADPSYNIVVVDSTLNAHDFTPVIDFVSGGGRALLEYWDVTSFGTLVAAFQANAVAQFTSTLPLYSWGGSTFFTHLSSPLRLVETAFNADGAKLQPVAGGRAVAGYVSGTTVNQAGIIVGHNGRTVLNGLFLEDADPIEDGIRLIQNELDSLVGPGPAAPPLVPVQPRSQTALAGASATFRVGAAGSLPISFHWRKNGVEVPTATNDTLNLDNVSFSQAGGYSVVLSNLSGSVTSSVALLTVTNSNPVSRILLFVDGTLESPYRTALGNLKLAFNDFVDQSAFETAMANAGTADTLVIVDSTFYSYSFGPLVAFLKSGGRAVVQYWNLTPSSTLAAALDVSVGSPVTTAPAIYDWGTSALFSGVGSPLPFNDLFNLDGQKLQPTLNGRAAAGYVASTAANQAALVVAKNGRTIVNSFILDQASNRNQAIQLAQNEISYFYNVLPPLIQSIARSGAGATLLWSAIPGRSYQIQFKNALSDSSWTDLGAPVIPPGCVVNMADANDATCRYYRVALLP